MKIGKISENVLKRSVLKLIKTKRKDVDNGAGIGKDCAIFVPSDQSFVAVSTQNYEIVSSDIPYVAVQSALNNIWTSGLEPVGVAVAIMLPAEAEEAILKQIMNGLEEACSEHGVQIMNGHTEVSEHVDVPVLTVTAFGKGANYKKGKAKAGQDIVLTKWIGLEGSYLLAKEKAEQLSQRYPMFLIEEAQHFRSFLSIAQDARIAADCGVCVMHDLSQGGVFAGLWDMAAGQNVGIEIEFNKLPIRQETVEICELFDLNLYALRSGGSLLFTCDDGENIVKLFEEKGIHATVIGRVTDNNDRVLIHGDEKRFLDLPKPDELYKIF